jgi:2-(1,2-epoxy-1,2-dihydrophenyl)acetyl-CoA isomerase
VPPGSVLAPSGGPGCRRSRLYTVCGVTAYEGVPGLLVSLDGPVLRLTFDKADRRNALDDTIVAGLLDAIDEAGRDERVRVIVLGAEGPDFCSGFDIVGRNAATGERRPRAGSIQRRLPSQAHRLIPMILRTQVPVVGVVRGWAAGIGLNLAVAADFTVASTDATFWAPFVGRGFTPDSGATWMLPRRIGEVRARDMVLLGRVVSGAEAADWGLVHQAVAEDALDATVEELVGRLAEAPTVALGLAKWLLHSGHTAPLDDHLHDEAFAMELSSRSDDFKEGLAAFREKREPRYEGR